MSPSADPLKSLTKHEKYYINGADLSFLVSFSFKYIYFLLKYSIQVENVLFRVHRYFFERESGYFVKQLATPASPGKEPKGTQDTSAIPLDNVTVEEFAIFLWVFYNP